MSLEIACVVDHDSRLAALIDVLRSEGFGVDGYRHADPAVKAFKSKKYDLILMELELTPSDGCDDPDITEASGEKEYWKIALYVLEQARASANKETPIIVVDYVIPGGKELPEAERVVLEKVTSKFLCVPDYETILAAIREHIPGGD